MAGGLSKLRKIALRLGLSVAVFFIATEALLRLFPQVLPGNMGNEVAMAYRRYGGMYYWDPPTKHSFMLPNIDQNARFNNYEWRHQTDKLGFRNPPGIGSDVLLVGDSMIYGHGVNYEQTVASFLREKGWEAYNLGTQGTSIDWQLLAIRMSWDKLKPKTIYLFPLVNDFDDISEEAVEFGTPPELELDIEALKKRRGDYRPGFKHYGERLRTVRLLGLLRRLTNRRPQPANNSSSTRPRWVNALLDEEQYARNAAYYGALFDDLAARCRRRGVELKVVFLHNQEPDEYWHLTQRALGSYLAEKCRQHDVPYYSTEELFKGHEEDCLLPHDGHFNEAGHRRLAEFIVEETVD